MVIVIPALVGGGHVQRLWFLPRPPLIAVPGFFYPNGRASMRSVREPRFRSTTNGADEAGRHSFLEV